MTEKIKMPGTIKGAYSLEEIEGWHINLSDDKSHTICCLIDAIRQFQAERDDIYKNYQDLAAILIKIADEIDILVVQKVMKRGDFVPWDKVKKEFGK